MREHPIPQDVTNYKFHIVGNMTLKQFAEIGLGVFIAALFYSTNLPNIVKYPLSLISFLGGVAVAFVPIEERPLDHWIITFIKIMYKPTKFFWKRTPKIPEAFTFTQNDNTSAIINEVDLTPARRQRIHEYLGSINSNSNPYAWNDDEQMRMSSILQSFQTVEVSSIEITRSKQKPNLDIRVRNLTTPYSEPTPGMVSGYDPNQAALAAPEGYEYDPITNQYVEQKQMLATDQVAAVIAVPEQEEIHIKHQVEADELAEQAEAAEFDENSSFLSGSSQPEREGVNTDAMIASHNVDLPFPTKPTEPNKIVGMVLTPDNKLVTDAIVEIKDQNGNIVRAIKSNMLGQFFVTTPLQSGQYYIDTEAVGKSFNTQQLILKGKIVDPIEVRSN